MRKLVSILNPWMSVAFAICAALQWNDPDPWLWIPMYGAATVACILATLRRLRPWISGVVGLVALAWAIDWLVERHPDARFPELFQTMKASNPAIEETRELYGLLIVVAWMLVLTLATRGARPREG